MQILGYLRRAWPFLTAIFIAAPCSINDPNPDFVKASTIALSEDEVLVATVQTLDVGPKGRFLITDQVSRRAWIFERDGHLMKELTPEHCHPGFTMNPLEARYLGEQQIILTNAGPWGHRFDVEGECIGGMHKSFTAPMTFGTSSSGLTYAFYGEHGGYLAKLDATGREVMRFDTPEAVAPGMTLRFRGGGVVADTDNVFFADVARPAIHVFDTNGTHLRTIEETPDTFDMVDEDLPGAGAQRGAILGAMSSFKSKSWVTDLLMLDADKLLIQYRHQDGYGYQIFSKEGKLLSENSGMEHRFLAAGRGVAYRVVQPEVNAAGELPNPNIEVCRYVGPASATQ